MLFGRQSIFSIFIFSIVLNFVFPYVLVTAQSSPSVQQSPNNQPTKPRRTPSTKAPQPEDKRATAMRREISQNKEIIIMCPNLKNIKFESTGNKLRIITRDQQCSYTIIQEVLQPQLNVGKIRTYEFTGDREDVIVTF